MPEFSPGARERKKRATRTRLQDAAITLFNERGVDATTVDEIASAAEVSPRTFFRYFATKDEVIFGDQAGDRAAIGAAVAGRPAGEPDHPALCNALVEFSDFLQAHRERVFVRSQLAVDNPSLIGCELLLQLGWQSAAAEALAARGGVHEPSFEQRVLAGSGVAALCAAVREWHATGGEGALPAFTRLAMAALAPA